MSREEILALRQESYRLATDFTRASAGAFDALNTGRPLGEVEPLVRECLMVGEEYERALDGLLAVLKTEPSDNMEEEERTLKFKELLRKELDLVKSHPRMRA